MFLINNKNGVFIFIIWKLIWPNSVIIKIIPRDLIKGPFPKRILTFSARFLFIFNR